jgi:hypothetical protein
MVRREECYRRALGPPREPSVYHFEDDHDPHVDVYVHARTPLRPFETMITGGLSDRPLPGVPRNSVLPRRVELLLRMSSADHWGATVLRVIAYLAFRAGVPLAPGTVIEGEPIAEGSLLCHALLLPGREKGLEGFRVADERVAFLNVTFLTEEELEWGLRNGGFELEKVLEEAGRLTVVDPWRTSVV